eukprot:3620121-Pleurochrysis_carterae.AAC.1
MLSRNASASASLSAPTLAVRAPSFAPRSAFVPDCMVSAPVVDSSLHRTLAKARAPRSVSKKVDHPVACC